MLSLSKVLIVNLYSPKTRLTCCYNQRQLVNVGALESRNPELLGAGVPDRKDTEEETNLPPPRGILKGLILP